MGPGRLLGHAGVRDVGPTASVSARKRGLSLPEHPRLRERARRAPRASRAAFAPSCAFANGLSQAQSVSIIIFFFHCIVRGIPYHHHTILSCNFFIFFYLLTILIRVRLNSYHLLSTLYLYFSGWKILFYLYSVSNKNEDGVFRKELSIFLSRELCI